MKPGRFFPSLGIVWLALACATEPKTATLPGTLLWVEWPIAVSTSQPGFIRVSGAPQCPQYANFNVTRTGTELHVAAFVDFTSGCVSRADTLLPIPPLPIPSSGLPVTYSIWGPLDPFTYPFTTNERLLGHIDLRATPDSGVQFAGVIYLYLDSLGCWRAIPTRAPRPTWSFADSLPLGPQSSGRVAILRGRMIPTSRGLCGDTLAIKVFELELDATPRPTPRSHLQTSR